MPIHTDEKIIELNKLIEKVVEDNKNQKIMIEKLKKDLEQYKTYNEKIINSYNQQFDTIFLYYDLEVKGLLKYNHILNQEILNFVDNICKKYNLDYWLDFGTLLGAYRHKGFIPWDDDIDLAMMRKDYEIFLKVIYDEIETNNLSEYLKIYTNLTPHKKIPMLQIFYTAGIPGVILGGADIAPYDFVGDISNCNPETFRATQRSVLKNIREGTPIDIAVNEYIKKFNVNYELDTYVIPAVEGLRGFFKDYPFEIMDADKIFPLKTLEFGKRQYKVPKDSKYYLGILYGDYNNVPKVIHHHHRRFEKLIPGGKVNQIYKRSILRLQEANESF